VCRLFLRRTSDRVGRAPVLIPVILGAAFLASLGPAESAVRGSLIEALEYE